jgi:excisionase family DNA binding protein
MDGGINLLENIIGVEEAANILRLSPGTIKNMCADGKLECKKIGKTWVLDKTNLEVVNMRVSEPLIWDLTMKFTNMLMNENSGLHDDYEQRISYIFDHTKNELSEEIAGILKERLRNIVETYKKTGAWDFVGHRK